ncbi:hypothetical protein [Bradyrhizobium diazoefficiens]
MVNPSHRKSLQLLDARTPQLLGQRRQLIGQLMTAIAIHSATHRVKNPDDASRRCHCLGFVLDDRREQHCRSLGMTKRQQVLPDVIVSAHVT